MIGDAINQVKKRSNHHIANTSQISDTFLYPDGVRYRETH